MKKKNLLGCCVLQKCIDLGNKDQIEIIIKIVTDNSYFLVKNKYGNYVVRIIF